MDREKMLEVTREGVGLLMADGFMNQAPLKTHGAWLQQGPPGDGVGRRLP